MYLCSNNITGGVVLYKQESRTPLAVYPNGSVVTSESEVSSGFYHVAVKCVGGNSAPGTWSGPDGSDISTNSFAHVAQDRGEFLVSNLETGYSNGNYKCRVGENEAVIGLYLTSGSHIGKNSIFAHAGVILPDSECLLHDFYICFMTVSRMSNLM